MKYGKSEVLICEIMGFVRTTSKRAPCQKLAFRDKSSLGYLPSYAMMTPFKSFYIWLGSKPLDLIKYEVTSGE